MDMKKCPECGAEITAVSEVCPECGYRFGLVGKKLSDEEDFTGSGISDGRDSITETIRIKSDRHRALLTFLKYGRYFLVVIAAVFLAVAVIELIYWTKDTFRDATFLKLIEKEKWLISFACAFWGLFEVYPALKDYFIVLLYADWIRKEKFAAENVMITVAHTISADEKTVADSMLLFAAAESIVNRQVRSRTAIKAAAVFIVSVAAAISAGLFLFSNFEGIILYETEKYVKIQLGTPAQEFTGYVWHYLTAIIAAVLYSAAAVMNSVIGVVKAEKLQEYADREIK